jgi:uncharacterized protein (TIGR02145 family)
MKKIKKNGILIFMATVMTVTIVGCAPWVEINGVKWATRNVNTPGSFADKPSHLGKLYKWDCNVGWDLNDTTGWKSTPAGKDSTTWKENICPNKWRLPTITEIKSLIASGSFHGTLNGVKGNFFVGKYNELLFFPFGILSTGGGASNSVDYYGDIWGVSDDNKKATSMGYQTGTASWDPNPEHGFGFCVRCVLK